MASNLTLTLYALILAHKKFKIKINFQEQIRIYIASAISAIPTIAVLHLSSLTAIPNLMMSATAYFITYLTLTPIMKCIDKQDLKILQQIFSKIKILQPITTLVIRYENRFIPQQ